MSSPSRPRVVSLFSGIGATDLALEALGCETVAHSDIEPYALDVFALRFPHSTPLGDVCEITAVPECEVMAGGFPCQDISNAGLRVGIGGARSGLWSEFFRLIGLARPRVVLIENVAALLNRGLDVVLADLASIGYACEWDCLPAAAVGAPHLRDRVWITAYPEDEPPVREAPLERSLGTLSFPPAKWPRAGRMEQGAVYVREPLAPRKTKRLNPGSAWIGTQLSTEHGWWHGPIIPTPTVGDSRNSRNATAGRKPGGNHHSGTTLSDFVTLFPTPRARDWKGSDPLARRPIGDDSLPTRIARGLWPTPTKADGTGGPGNGGRDGGKNLRTAVGGSLNPRWVEWLMGFPLGWTDLSAPDTRFHGWNFEPNDVPRVATGVLHRKGRLTALGNGQVPQVMHWWAAPAIARLA